MNYLNFALDTFGLATLPTWSTYPVQKILLCSKKNIYLIRPILICRNISIRCVFTMSLYYACQIAGRHTRANAWTAAQREN